MSLNMINNLINIKYLSQEKQHILIYEIELTSFNEKEKVIVSNCLWNYILENRFTKDDDETVAVGSAIRKYVAIMPIEKINSLEELLDDDEQLLSDLIRIELIKSICRFFEVYVPQKIDQFSNLSKYLDEIITEYSYYGKVHLIPNYEHCTVALLSIEGIMLMKSNVYAKNVIDSLQQINKIDYKWFISLVYSRVIDIQQHWKNKGLNESVDWINPYIKKIKKIVTNK